jgi:hypothetical protein
MKRKKTNDSQLKYNRQMEKIALFAAFIVIISMLLLLCRIQLSMLDNTWWIRLLVTQIVLLVGCLVSLKWMRVGALISGFSAPFGAFMFVKALEPFDSTLLMLFVALAYGSVPLAIGLEQWELGNLAHASAADSQPRQNSKDSITSLVNPLDGISYPSSSGAGGDSSGGVDLGGGINAGSGGIDADGIDAGGIDAGGIDLGSGIDLSGIDLSGLIDLGSIDLNL